MKKIHNLADFTQKLEERGLIISERFTDSDDAQKFSEEMTKFTECFFNAAVDISNK